MYYERLEAKICKVGMENCDQLIGKLAYKELIYPKIFIMSFSSYVHKPLYYDFDLEITESNLSNFLRAFVRNEINYMIFSEVTNEDYSKNEKAK